MINEYTVCGKIVFRFGQGENIGKTNDLNVIGSNKTIKGLNTIAEIC